MLGIFAVIVLYGERAEDSRTVRSVKQAFAERPSLVAHFSFLIYDNNRVPKPISTEAMPADCRVVQARQNLGVVAAYNEALRQAEARNFRWLLLLDSDTEMTAAFLEACIRETEEMGGDSRVGAFVPHVVEGRLIHSPRFIRGMRRRAVPLSWSGIYPYEIVAPNSGSLLSVSAVRSLGGFNEEFWLDYQDYWLFRAMQRKGYQVYVLGERIEHSLSFADPTRRMPLERYRNMLNAEFFFTARYGDPEERVRLRILLLKRAVALLLKRRGGLYVRALLKTAFRPYRSAKPPTPPIA